MAYLEFDFPEDFLSDLLDTDVDEIAEEALKEAAPILEASMKRACKSALKHEGDSELVDSITARKPKKAKTDAWIVNVSPKGYSNTKVYKTKGKKPRTYPVSNTLKAIWKEYGIPGRQPPRPFIQSACNTARNDVMNKLQDVYNRKVGAE